MFLSQHGITGVAHQYESKLSRKDKHMGGLAVAFVGAIGSSKRRAGSTHAATVAGAAALAPIVALPVNSAAARSAIITTGAPVWPPAQRGTGLHCLTQTREWDAWPCQTLACSPDHQPGHATV